MLALYSGFVLNLVLQRLGSGGKIDSMCPKSQIKKKKKEKDHFSFCVPML